jgi:hypothetical protein
MLRKTGHDVLAVDEHRELEGVPDPALMELAAEQRRILVTFNVQDFPDILREWAGEGRDHGGCILMVGLDHSEFGLIATCLDTAFQRIPDPESWRNLPMFLSRSDGQGRT